VANILLEAGANFDKISEMLPPDEHNPKGYFESKEVVALNKALILGKSVSFPSASGSARGGLFGGFMENLKKINYFLPPREAVIERRAAKIKDEILKIAQKRDQMVIKDVRFSYTMGAWAKYLPIEKVAYCFRHPSEVASSLSKSYKIPLSAGYWVWKVRVEKFLSQADGIPIVFINYNNLLDEKTQESEIQRLFEFLERKGSEEEIKKIISSVIDRNLYKQVSINAQLPENIASLYRTLREFHRNYCTLKPFDNNRLENP
tara:strand:- start:2515 stop:3297 length:783 start_codon:yes stop_codon:yes gene_type:complete